jgi:hypothetical protein
MGIANCAMVHSSAEVIPVVIPMEENHFLSWRAKLSTAMILSSCKTLDERIDVLKNKMDHDFLDFAGIQELNKDQKFDEKEKVSILEVHFLQKQEIYKLKKKYLCKNLTNKKLIKTKLIDWNLPKHQYVFLKI